VNFQSAIALLLAALIPGAYAAPGRDASGAAPPPVTSRSVSVNRGESVNIPLEIHGDRGESLEFVIRTRPRYGRLSGIAPRGFNGASVRYTAPSKPGIMEDRFTFAVRGSAGVSAPGVVTLTIVDPPDLPQKLVIPVELEFPSIFMGQRSSAELELVNEGGGVVEGQVTVKPPWSIEGPKEYRIAGRQRIGIKLVLSPETAGPQTGEAIVGGVPRRAVALRGSAQERLEVTPAHLALSAEVGSQTRTAVLHVVNRSEEDAKVAVTAGARILAVATAIVPARRKMDIPVFADAADVTAFDDELKLTCDRWTATIPVRVPALGPMLRFARNDAVFGRVIAGQSGDGSVRIENTGGEPATVQVEIDPPFKLGTNAVLIASRGRVELEVRLPPREPGIYEGNLRASVQGREVKLAIRAEVVAKPTPPTPAADPAKSAAGPPETTKEASPDENPEPLTTTRQEHPNAMGAFGNAKSPTTAAIDWPAKIGPTGGIRIDERDLVMSGDGELQINWVPVENVQLQQNGDRMRAELHRLRPARLHTMRVVAGRGEAAQTLFTVQFWTPEKAPLVAFSWTKLWLLAAAALAGFVAFTRLKNRKPSWR
jgi:hypothetical protein